MQYGTHLNDRFVTRLQNKKCNAYVKTMKSINVVDSVVTSNKNLRNEQTKTTLEITRTTFTANPFLVTFFNFFFYLALVPFKTVLDQNQNKYQIKTYCVHQVTKEQKKLSKNFKLKSFLFKIDR